MKQPVIQKAWKEFKELAEEFDNALQIENINFVVAKMIVFIIPYILANFLVVNDLPRSNKKPHCNNGKKNRNI